MARLKTLRRPQPQTSPPGRAASVDDAALFDAVLENRRPSSDDPAAVTRWRELRQRLYRDVCGGPFDPRNVLLLTGAGLADFTNGAADGWRRNGVSSALCEAIPGGIEIPAARSFGNAPGRVCSAAKLTNRLLTTESVELWGRKHKWVASLERELWRLRLRTTDWPRLNVTLIDGPTVTTPVVVRPGPRLLTASR
jgi:hypothetical protein